MNTYKVDFVANTITITAAFAKAMRVVLEATMVLLAKSIANRFFIIIFLSFGSWPWR